MGADLGRRRRDLEEGTAGPVELDRRSLLLRLGIGVPALALGLLGPGAVDAALADPTGRSGSTRSTRRRSGSTSSNPKSSKQPAGNPIDSITGPNDVLVVVGPDGTRLRNQNPTLSFVPASTLKVVTALTALDRLGPDFRFRTTFRLDGQGRLIVEGGGDPYLVSEELDLIASRLAPLAPAGGFTGVRVDDSAFAPGLVVPGASDTANPYDAPVGALSANFNTILVRRTAKGVESGEAQTPLTPTARDVALGWKFRGWARVNLHDADVTARYTGELLAAMLRKRGVKVGPDVDRVAGAGTGLPALYVHQQSRPLTEVLQDCLHTSSNFIANQVFLTLGLIEFGAPATFEKGAQVVRAHLAARGLDEGFTIVEGSGLSRDDQATAEGYLKVLDAFEPWIGLLRLHEGSPSKTGTLSGTRTLIGYFDHEKYGHLHYVIYLSGNRSGVRFELVRLFRDYL